jgi:hypothetical protein
MNHIPFGCSEADVMKRADIASSVATNSIMSVNLGELDLGLSDQ